ncbi:hypothetical protein RvY_05015 [Ramazzottius varieornatus]|uniref:Uncharacterized protein n=1 Tax=Ramazzottius varieornatus TaxID=947166 RepID=A0A1D1UX40_RAMVA|nr:hypothetical protein RvY_05015 [Ramazzottius varieornatus]
MDERRSLLLCVSSILIHTGLAAPHGFGPYVSSTYERRPYSSSYSGGSYKEPDPYPVYRVAPAVRAVEVLVQHHPEPLIVPECLLCKHVPFVQEDSMDVIIPLPRPRNTLQVEVDASFSSHTQSESFPVL